MPRSFNPRPIRLSRRSKPFDSPEWIYELKVDGFRALAFVESGKCRLMSRNGHAFKGFEDLKSAIASHLKGRAAILDGEICCLDDSGRSQFYPLLFKRRESVCYFYAFDLLSLDGEDLRELPLIGRKSKLGKLIGRRKSRLLYLDHIEGQGSALFERICDMDLEGIVAKRKTSKYIVTEKPSAHWVKIKNPSYSQAEGRVELFEVTLKSR